MQSISREQSSSADKNNRWLLATAVGFVAILLLAAATDHRSTIVDLSSTGTAKLAGPIQTPDTHELVREMLTHD